MCYGYISNFVAVYGEIIIAQLCKLFLVGESKGNRENVLLSKSGVIVNCAKFHKK